MNRFGALLICLAASGTFPSSGPQYEVGPVDARIVSGPDEDGDLLISIKVMVSNYSDSELAVSLSIQGCDSEGFELAEFDLEGTVDATTTKAITDTDYIEPRLFEMITNWVIEEVEVSSPPDH